MRQARCVSDREMEKVRGGKGRGGKECRGGPQPRERKLREGEEY